MKLFLTVLLLFTCIFLSAQKSEALLSAHISGKIIDSVSNQPVEYATISLFLNNGNKPYTGTISDKKGAFEIDSLEKGLYSLQIEFIGYKTKSLQFTVTEDSRSINLNNIKLLNTATILSGITITATTPLIENKIDKMVYNVEKDISSQGGVATDVLKKVPQVSVDIDGNVSLQGNSNIRFLINGKPSTIFGNSLSDALQSIPASQIQSIEVITSPGAQYEAEGTAGIINIILKKNNAQGFNGNINISAGSRLENAALNFNFRHNNFNINVYFSGNGQISSTIKTQYDRQSFDSLNSHFTDLLQNGRTDYKRNGLQTGTGFDWAINKHNNLNGTFSFESYTSSNQSIINQELVTDSLMTHLSDVNTIRTTENHFNSHSFDLNLNYKKTFAREKQELDITYIASIGRNYIYYLQSQAFPGNTAFAGTNGNNPGTDNETDIAIDYTHPLSNKLTIESGLRQDFNVITSSANVYNLVPASGDYLADTSQSYNINYKRNIYAYYLSGTFNISKNIDAIAGARYEYTTTNAFYSNAHNVSIPDYSTLVPSLILSYNLSEGTMLKLAYSKRIERPDYRDLNPFLNATDPHNITTGNPLLQPEIGNKMEVDVSKFYEKGLTLNLSLYYNINTHDIKSYILYYPQFKVGDSLYNDVSITSRLNISSEKTAGINLFASFPIENIFNFRTNLTLANRRIYNNLINNYTNGYEYRINANASLKLGKEMTAEVFGNYNSRVHNVQGLQPAFLFYNLALRRQILKKQGSIAFLTTNPFNLYINQRTNLIGPDFIMNNLRQLPLQSFGINFTYKFGKLEFKKIKEPDLNSQVQPQE